MKIRMTSHGGWSGMLGPRAKAVDTALLTPPEAEEAIRLIRAAQAEAADGAPEPDRRHAPEAMSYTISIDDDGTTCTIRASDLAPSPAVASLMNWLQRNARD